jgi:hypothetical protein
MFEYNYNGIYFRCHEENDRDRELKIDNEIPNFRTGNHFKYNESGNHPFDPNRDEIIFDSSIEPICFRIFDIVKKMYEENIPERYSSLLVARLFETFAGYWSNVLLSKNHDRVGIVFWKKILDIVKKWKAQNPKVFIHTGTPYYFLAENYLLVGDLDSAFSYLHDANYIDQQSWQWEQHDHIGSYCLAKLLNKDGSQMNYIVRDLRNELRLYISLYNEKNNSFTIGDFDNKFLRNEKELLDVGYFFTYNFFSIVQRKRNKELELENNTFSKLRSLDIIFNLCLIIDKILHNTYLKDESDISKTTMSYGVEKLCQEQEWSNSYQLIKFWEQEGKFDKAHPENSIPLLLEKNEIFENKPVESEVFTMILAYILRNYGAHNLNNEDIILQKYDEIITELMMALFISVSTIKQNQLSQ